MPVGTTTIVPIKRRDETGGRAGERFSLVPLGTYVQGSSGRDQGYALLRLVIGAETRIGCGSGNWVAATGGGRFMSNP